MGAESVVLPLFSFKEQDRPWELHCFLGEIIVVLPFLCLSKHGLGLLIALERLVESSLPCCGMLGVWCVVDTGHSLVAVVCSVH